MDGIEWDALGILREFTVHDEQSTQIVSLLNEGPKSLLEISSGTGLAQSSCFDRVGPLVDLKIISEYDTQRNANGRRVIRYFTRIRSIVIRRDFTGRVRYIELHFRDSQQPTILKVDISKK